MMPVKAALIGLQHPHSRSHLYTLQRLPEVGSILLWDEDPAVLAQIFRSQGEKIEATFTDLGHLLSQEDLAFAVTALPNDRSADTLVRVLEAGVPVLAEKPIGRTAAETAGVVDTARRLGLQLGVCYLNRSHPLVQDACRFAAQGLLGPLASVNMQLLTTQVRFRNPDHWLFQRERSGGGILSWLGCHYLDLMHVISGDEVVALSAEMATRSAESIDVEDVASVQFRFRSGAIGTLQVGYCLAVSGAGYQNRRGYATHASFQGQSGRLYWHGDTIPPARLFVESTHPDWVGAPVREFGVTLAESPAYGGVYGEEFVRTFIGAVQGKGHVIASGHDALRVARIVDAAYLSAQTGRRVELFTP